MLELQKTVAKLAKIRDYYRVKINEIAPFCPPMTVSPVVIAPNDYNCLNSLLPKLISQLKQFSTSLAQTLTDLHAKLCIFNNNLAYFNPFHFGAFSAILDYLSSKDFICNFAKYIITPWEDVNDSLMLFLQIASTAKNRLEYNQVGVTAREIYIVLANKVYIKEIHKDFSDKKISDADAFGMLNAYFVSKAQNKNVRKYAEAAVDLAETVTHIKSEDRERLNALVVAVVSLIGLVSNIYLNS